MKISGSKTCWIYKQLQVAAQHAGLDYTEEENQDVSIETAIGTFVGPQAAATYMASLRPDIRFFGKNQEESCQVRKWMTDCREKLEEPMIKWCREKQSTDSACKEFLVVLDTHLAKNTYLVGERISMADIFVATPIADGFRCMPNVYNEETCAEMRHLTRWLRTLVNLPAMKKIFDVKLPEIQVEKPKKKTNPMDDLPPTTLVLDEWKRCYSNTKDLNEAMKWFWDHYDAEGYSLWFMEYDKVEGECTVSFITSNQVGGFLQRLDGAVRKYSFGVVQILGTEGDFNYSAVWMFRGQEIPFEMRDHPSFEYHNFRKMDPVAERELVNTYWIEENEIRGKPIADCKVWK
eukprot:GHVO01023284.1.p1 GENE.GHVO01023284.1~~GHVO01023284.1.p1  ORF type:complete len:365 (-),score=64.85 GHVO01023284.1:141-1181(-)